LAEARSSRVPPLAFNVRSATVRRRNGWTRLEQLADEHLALMSAIGWADAASAIRRRQPAPAGETFGFEEGTTYFELADSYRWADREGGDILQTITAYDAAGNSAERVRRLSRPGA